mmetsp:Transcript_14170/g.34447  ORF Transcript_14170/g.34447 Transcript_14170/m.34447 type:complete len:232 (+) Transcript_14170:6-701(+)
MQAVSGGIPGGRPISKHPLTKPLLHVQHHQLGVLQVPAEDGGEPGDGRAVQVPVIPGAGDVHDLRLGRRILPPPLRLDPAKRQDRRLPVEQYGLDVGSAHNTHIRDGKSTSGDVIPSQPPASGRVLESDELGLDLPQGEVLHVLDVRHHQPMVRGVNCQGDVVAGVDGVLRLRGVRVVFGVDDGHLGQGQAHGLHGHRGQSQLAGLCLQLLLRRHQCGGLHLVEDRQMGDR